MNNETSINPHNKVDVTGLIRNGKPQVRGFETKPLPENHQKIFFALCMTQGKSIYPDVLRAAKYQVKYLNIAK